MKYGLAAQSNLTAKYRHTIVRAWRLFSLLLLLLLFKPTAYSQLTTADIVGTVSDATGAIIPNATVTLTNLRTNEKRVTHTSGSGDYNFTLLLPGHYSISVQSPGFKAAVTSDLGVEAGDRARADAHMQLGAESTTVEVEAQTPLLQADNATVSSTVTEKAVQDLPLNGRNFVQLVQLVPGANEGPGNGLTSGGRPDDRRQTAGFSVNGQDDTLNNYVIDGIDNNERVIGTIGVRPNVEGIQEITVQTNSYAAEAGRTAGGVVNIVTRSGSNQFHGTAYEYFRNDIFDARNVFQTTGNKPELRQNQYGASIGGPIIKDRTFFFGDYEGFRQVSGVTYTSTVPTIDEYNAIHSIGGSSPEMLVAGGNKTQGLPIDPIALNYLSLFPTPTNQAPGVISNNYIASPSKTQYSNVFDARIDHRFSDKNLLFARYTYNKIDTVTPQALGTQNGLDISGGRYNFAGPATDAAQQYALNFTHIFTPSLLVDLKAAYTRINNLSLPLNYGKNADTQVGFGPNMNFNTLSNFLTPIQFGPFSDIGDGAYVPLQDIDNTFQYLGTVSWTKGNHNVKFGASLIRRQAKNIQSAFAAGQYTFGLSTDACVPGTTYDAATNDCGSTAGTSNTASAKQRQDNQLASSLVGAFSNEGRNYDLFPPNYRSWEPSAFIQDSWKATPKLTVLIGVRYDVFTPFTEAQNHISNFDFTQALSSTAGNVGSALKVAGVNGVSATAGIKTNYSDVAPRLGFSLSITPTIVLRGGYGLSFFPGNYTSNADLKNAPFVSVYNPNCQAAAAINIQLAAGQSLTNGNPQCNTAAGQPDTFDAGLPLPAAQTLISPSLSFVAEDPNFRPAMMQQFNLQVEQQFGANVFTIGYVGNIGQHLPEEINDINVPKPFDPAISSGARQLATQLPNLGGVNWLRSEGISNYNALQTSFQRRFSRGLAFDANYTWAKGLSDITGFSEEGQQGWSNADPTRIRQIEYGIAENDIQNRFALSLNYEFQYGKNFTGAKKLALSGWQMNTISVWQSGKPFSIVNGGDGTQSNRATPFNNGGDDRPNQIGDARLGHKTLSHFFNTAAFAKQPLGTVGTAQRNSLFGPNFRHVDLSLFKTFPVTERLGIQFRAECYNISNTPNFYINNNTGNSSTQLGNAAFGTVAQTDPNYVPRQYQFAIKAQF
jgi:hypothetical protein